MVLEVMATTNPEAELSLTMVALKDTSTRGSTSLHPTKMRIPISKEALPSPLMRERETGNALNLDVEMSISARELSVICARPPSLLTPRKKPERRTPLYLKREIGTAKNARISILPREKSAIDVVKIDLLAPGLIIDPVRRSPLTYWKVLMKESPMVLKE